MERTAALDKTRKKGPRRAPITASLIGIISEKAGTYGADEKAERLTKKHKIKCPKR